MHHHCTTIKGIFWIEVTFLQEKLQVITVNHTPDIKYLKQVPECVLLLFIITKLPQTVQIVLFITHIAQNMVHNVPKIFMNKDIFLS